MSQSVNNISIRKEDNRESNSKQRQCESNNDNVLDGLEEEEI